MDPGMAVEGFYCVIRKVLKTKRRGGAHSQCIRAQAAARLGRQGSMLGATLASRGLKLSQPQHCRTCR
ncbi:hypothetical protein MAPG_03143 [Magnaporthiopsis poae ATCC 64411]|uniref:Uncharacterized protein n=1 Tax=Magnaporthiopsis poae (strain ATCC 64411 / 73-15) TaxID=644358 RepID=A0A0C4DT83_MAGP6|nr:hypothetical protein MAPG_03143 [Magnaporthiopsis poae ATCC 64411]